MVGAVMRLVHQLVVLRGKSFEFGVHLVPPVLGKQQLEMMLSHFHQNRLGIGTSGLEDRSMAHICI